MLRRILCYAQKVVDRAGWSAGLRHSARPRIPAARAVRAFVVRLWSRLGRLNALGQTRPRAFWRSFLGGAWPRADTCGRVCEGLDPQAVRELQQELYTRLKRRKALEPPKHGLMVAV